MKISNAQLFILFLARTALNIAFRIIYPFLPSIARGLGISLTAASGLVTLRVVAGLAAPLLGPIADQYSRRRTMQVALLLFTLAGMLIAGAGTLALASLAFILFGLAKALFDPAVHAYIGDAVPYQKRGRAMGIIEFSWSAAWLLGVPAAGLLIERAGWRAPWAALIALGLLGIWLIQVGLPAVQRPAQRHSILTLGPTILAAWRGLLSRRRVVILLAVSLLLTMANEIPFIVYGAWFETSFGLSLSALGLASMVVGLAEATAEMGATVLTDRLGKQRSILLGLCGLAASLAVLPWFTRLGVVAALGGVALMMLAFEFAIVSLLPLASELAPNARASFLSINLTAFALGRILGAMAGSWLWRWQSITPHAIAGIACALAAALLVAKFEAGEQDNDWHITADKTIYPTPTVGAGNASSLAGASS